MIYDSFAQLGAAEPPDAFGSPEAWGAYIAALRDKLAASKKAAVAAYNTLKQVRSNLGLPFMGGTTGEGNADLGAWSSDLEQQAVDILAMSKICVDAANDVLASKRKLWWDDQLGDFAVEGFASDVLRLRYGPQGFPVLVDGAGNEKPVTGQVGMPVLVFAGIAALAVVQAVGIYLVVNKGLETLQVALEQRTQKTLAEATKKHADLVASGKATASEAAALNNSMYAGAANLQKQMGDSKKPPTPFNWNTLLWVGLGAGILYVAWQAMKGGAFGMPALAAARDNPWGDPWGTSKEDLERALDKDEAALSYNLKYLAQLERGEKVPGHSNLTLAGMRQNVEGLQAAIKNKKHLLALMRDNPSFGRRNLGDYTHLRASYLPASMRDVPPFTPSGTDLEIWTWEDEQRGKTVFHGIAFAGKAGKPLWHHWFATEASRLSMIERSIASRKAHAEYKDKRLAKRRDFAHTLKVGDVLYTSFGYDQTNVDFYQVVETKGKSVVVCKIGSKEVESNQNLSYVVPIPGKCYGKTSLHRVGEGDYVKIDDHHASKWNGKPVYETASGWGH